MSWSAKPKGEYSLASEQGSGNAFEISNYFTGLSYTYESQAGIIGNVMAESGLNPWRWQSDTVNYSSGYGLFQYTPASSYINGATGVSGYAPNLSVTAQTSGAKPSDGNAQLIVFSTNSLGKWTTTCWRPYWDKNTYTDLYSLRTKILNKYGDGTRLTMKQFSAITDIYDATFAFLACFEGPAVPNMTTRYDNALAAYVVITGEHPPTPPTPPTPSTRKKMPLWFYLKPF